MACSTLADTMRELWQTEDFFRVVPPSPQKGPWRRFVDWLKGK